MHKKALLVLSLGMALMLGGSSPAMAWEYYDPTDGDGEYTDWDDDGDLGGVENKASSTSTNREAAQEPILSAQARERMGKHLMHPAQLPLEDDKLEPPEVSLEHSRGAFRVKMEPGWRLMKHDRTTRVLDKNGTEAATDTGMELSEEFPGMRVERLFGEENVEMMARLKERGERLSGRTLPDLSRWFHVTPEPSLANPLVVSQREPITESREALFV